MRVTGYVNDPYKAPGDTAAAAATAPAVGAASEAPPRSARKADWDAYATSIGIDTTGMTKEDLVDAVEEAQR